MIVNLPPSNVLHRLRFKNGQHDLFEMLVLKHDHLNAQFDCSLFQRGDRHLLELQRVSGFQKTTRRFCSFNKSHLDTKCIFSAISFQCDLYHTLTEMENW